MGIKAPPKVKFNLIYKALNQGNCLLNVSHLCQIANVSRTGYYAWLAAAPKRAEREEDDRRDFETVLEAFRYRYLKGARGIYMLLLHRNQRMNIKKIIRLMHKYDLKCPIRKHNPYRQMAKNLKTSNVAKNLLQRRFSEFGARKVLLTDITYLFYKGGKCYLSTVIDAFTHELLDYKLSESLEVEFVLEMVDSMIDKHHATLDNETIIHSDQGCHYTSYAFINKIKDINFIQSMSRRGNCWDNAPQESFYGHMTDEIKHEVYKLKTFKEVSMLIEDWMDYYNNERYQWDLLKLSPHEFYKYTVDGIYPLQIYKRARKEDK